MDVEAQPAPELASPNVSFLGYLKNGVAYNAGNAAADVGVTALDDRTCVVMEALTPFFPMVASLWPFFPLPRDVIQASATTWMEPENIQTIGPFIFDRGPRSADGVPPQPATGVSADAESGSSIGCIRTRRSRRWPATRRTSWSSRKCRRRNRSGAGRCEAERRSGALAESRNWHCGSTIAIRTPVLKNVNLRKALYLAIDRDLIVKQLSRAGRRVAELRAAGHSGQQPERGPGGRTG